MTVDAGIAAWLKAPALFAEAFPGGVAWGADQAVEVEFTTPIDAVADADAEAARTLAIIAGPNVKDRVLVRGQRRDLLNKCVTIKSARQGYSGAGTKVFVLGATEIENGTTLLTVLRKL
jgi:hypothetical protein